MPRSRRPATPQSNRRQAEHGHEKFIILRVYPNRGRRQEFMSARQYRLGERQASVAQTRARIIAAARKLLGAADASAAFTVDAVAAKAGVARMTVFNQFGCK